MHQQRGHSHAANEERQADGRLNDQPKLCLIYDKISLVNPGGKGESEEVRKQRDGAKNPGAVDHVLVEFFSFENCQASRPNAVRIVYHCISHLLATFRAKPARRRRAQLRDGACFNEIDQEDPAVATQLSIYRDAR